MNKGVPENVCIIVLNWNNWPDTIQCLESLRNLSSVPKTIIVCDNGSTDDSQKKILEWAQAHYQQGEALVIESADVFEKISSEDSPGLPRFVYLQSDYNRGFAGGNNLGLRWAFAQDHYHYFWLLNNDTVVKPPALSALLGCSSQNPDVGIWGSTVCWMHDRNRIQCAGGYTYSPLTTVFKNVLANEPVADAVGMESPPSLDYVFGASFFVKKEVFSEIGLLSEDFFLN